MRSQDTPARFGGDEFAILLDEVGAPSEQGRRHALAVARRIVGSLCEPFTIAGQSVSIGATVGIAYADGTVPELDGDLLLAHADLALYDAKRDGGGQARCYQPAMRTVHLERLQLEVDLQDALPGAQLEVHYQPIVGLETGSARALEALLRWHRPGAGLVAPGTFVPIAETTGLIVPIGRRVLDQTCAQLATWRRRLPGLTANVNASVQQLHDKDFVGDVEAALHRAGLPGSALTLEVTESMLLQDQTQVVDRLHDLKRLGLLIALDDFGTGYSCLS